MKSKLLLLVLAIAGSDLNAQNSCATKLAPIQPIAPLGCVRMDRECICTNGNCRWEWLCVPVGPESFSTSPVVTLPPPQIFGSGGIDASIPLSAVQPSNGRFSLLDAAMKAQQIRLMQQEYQAREQEQLRVQQQPQYQPSPAPEPQSRQAGPMETEGYVNGHLWTEMSATQKGAYVLGLLESLSFTRYTGKELPAQMTRRQIATALDTFYADTANRTISIVSALQAIAIGATTK